MTASLRAATRLAHGHAPAGLLAEFAAASRSVVRIRPASSGGRLGLGALLWIVVDGHRRARHEPVRRNNGARHGLVIPRAPRAETRRPNPKPHAVGEACIIRRQRPCRPSPRTGAAMQPDPQQVRLAAAEHRDRAAVAAAIGASHRQLRNWQQRHPEVRHALMLGDADRLALDYRLCVGAPLGDF